MFSFYCMGMNFVDIAHLKRKNIKGDRLVFVRKKMRSNRPVEISIKITLPIREILDIYINNKGPDDYIFPVINSERNVYNDYDYYHDKCKKLNQDLGKISSMLKLDIKLSSGTARHTWATIGRNLGFDTRLIGEGMGHENESTTAGYFDSFENPVLDKANEMITNLE